MRLYSMYFLCKNNIKEIESFNILTRAANGNTIKYVTNWQRIISVLNKLAGISCVRPATEKFLESVPSVYRDREQFDLDNTSAEKLTSAKKELLARLDTIIKLYESSHSEKKDNLGFDIKLPDFDKIEEISNCMKDLEFVINQCPYLNIPDSEIKYESADVGSFWITFFVVGTAATTVLINLSKIIEAAIRIKSQVVTVKQQEEELRSLQMKNNLSSDVIDAFRQVNKNLTDKCVRSLESDLGELPNGEDADKVGKSMEKLAFWMEKGMQIYSAIDAPKDIKVLFPQQEEQKLLNDDVIKLLEAKEEL